MDRSAVASTVSLPVRLYRTKLSLPLSRAMRVGGSATVFIPCVIVYRFSFVVWPGRD